MPALKIENLSVELSSKKVLNDVSFSVAKKD